MKKICLLFNHLRYQDGVGRSAISIANQLTRLNLAEVTLIPLFTNEKKTYSLIDDGVHVKSVFGFYFKGMSWLLSKIPKRLIRWYIMSGEKYDIEVAFQFGLSQRCISAPSPNNHALRFSWMHGYDEKLVFKDEYKAIGTVCCVSRSCAERLHNEMPTIKVDYNYNPIDDDQVRELGLEQIEIDRPDGLLFVTVGRLSPEKGYERLLYVMQKLKAEGFKFHLWIIGDGPLEYHLKKKQKDLGLIEEVLFLGSHKNPHKYTSRADIFVCSSYSEGYSTACTEAIMLGIPVITTNVNGSKEIIDDAECGLITGMDDNSLYEGLKQVCIQPQLISEWKNKLLKTRYRFSASIRIQRLVNLFNLKNV